MKARSKPRNKRSHRAKPLRSEKAAVNAVQPEAAALPRIVGLGKKFMSPPVPVSELMDKVGSIFKLCNLASKRATELNQGAPKLVEYESRKLSNIGLEEIRQGKITLNPQAGEAAPIRKRRSSKKAKSSKKLKRRKPSSRKIRPGKKKKPAKARRPVRKPARRSRVVKKRRRR